MGEANGRWSGLGSICRVERVRRTGNKVERNIAYYISNLTGPAEQLERAIRAHWERSATSRSTCSSPTSPQVLASEPETLKFKMR